MTDFLRDLARRAAGVAFDAGLLPRAPTRYAELLDGAPVPAAVGRGQLEEERPDRRFLRPQHAEPLPAPTKDDEENDARTLLPGFAPDARTRPATTSAVEPRGARIGSSEIDRRPLADDAGVQPPTDAPVARPRALPPYPADPVGAAAEPHVEEDQRRVLGEGSGSPAASVEPARPRTAEFEMAHPPDAAPVARVLEVTAALVEPRDERAFAVPRVPSAFDVAPPSPAELPTRIEVRIGRLELRRAPDQRPAPVTRAPRENAPPPRLALARRYLDRSWR